MISKRHGADAMAFCLGVAGTAVVSIAAYRGLHGEARGGVVLYFLVVIAAAGLLVFMTRPREIVSNFLRDPASAPAALLTFGPALLCVWADGFVWDSLTKGSTQLWHVVVALLVTFLSSALILLLLVFIYRGSRRFIRSAISRP